jgi:hypothetical protein
MKNKPTLTERANFTGDDQPITTRMISGALIRPSGV